MCKLSKDFVPLAQARADVVPGVADPVPELLDEAHGRGVVAGEEHGGLVVADSLEAAVLVKRRQLHVVLIEKPGPRGGVFCGR